MVIRGELEKLETLSLKPRTWAGRGLLGCVFVSYIPRIAYLFVHVLCYALVVLPLACRCHIVPIQRPKA